MDENDILTPEMSEIIPVPDYDPDEWDRKRREAQEAALAPYRATRNQINEHDELMADILYEITLMEIGGEE